MPAPERSGGPHGTRAAAAGSPAHGRAKLSPVAAGPAGLAQTGGAGIRAVSGPAGHGTCGPDGHRGRPCRSCLISQAATAGVTHRAIYSPLALDHGKAVLALQLQPELRVPAEIRPRRSATSAATLRRPFRMPATRPENTPRSSARRFALKPRAASSRPSSRPARAIGGTNLSGMMIDHLTRAEEHATGSGTSEPV